MTGYYDVSTVMLSFFIAVITGFVTFEVIDHARHSTRPPLWTATGGLTLGLGIWSVHFIGMLAWHPPFPLYYDLRNTLFSIVLSGAASAFALYLTTRDNHGVFRSDLIGAFVIGLGIFSMHYVGMDALHFLPTPMWDPGWVAVSLAVAVAASWGTLFLLHRGRAHALSIGAKLGGSVCLGAAICGMHYAGMYSMKLRPHSVSIWALHSFQGQTLARVGVGNAVFFTLGLLVILYHDKARWAREAEEARFRALDSAWLAEKLAIAGKMSASIAHEINNPLEAVTNLLYLLQYEERTAETKVYLQEAQQEVKRISEIVTHTLNFYRQSAEPDLCSISGLFESCLSLFRKRLQDYGIAAEKRWPSDLPLISCQSGEIRQVLANLMSNAIDAMPHGGRLLLSIEREDDLLAITVADSGPGIPSELQKKILEPFFTTKGPRGTGLGLSISAEILARHKGTLNFESSTVPGRSGTSFRLTLPCPQETRGQATASSFPACNPREGFEKPLLYGYGRADRGADSGPNHASDSRFYRGLQGGSLHDGFPGGFPGGIAGGLQPLNLPPMQAAPMRQSSPGSSV